HTSFSRDWSSDVCSSDLLLLFVVASCFESTLNVYRGVVFWDSFNRCLSVALACNHIHETRDTLPSFSWYFSLRSGHTAMPCSSNSSLCPASLIQPVCLAGLPTTNA